MTKDTEYTQSRYMVCIDGSDVARKAMRFACMKAKKRNLLIDLLHVVPPVESQSLESIQEKMESDLRANAEKMLQEHADEAMDLSGHMPSLLIRHGDIVDEIIKQIDEDSDYDANMLVLGIEPDKGSRGKLASRIIGHMGTKISIPIMLVPSNLTDEQMESLG